jgi:hypothetical protein
MKAVTSALINWSEFSSTVDVGLIHQRIRCARASEHKRRCRLQMGGLCLSVRPNSLVSVSSHQCSPSPGPMDAWCPHHLARVQLTREGFLLKRTHCCELYLSPGPGL